MIISGIQRQEKQREAWIELLRLLHDPNNNFCHHQPQLVRLEKIMRANWSRSGCKSWQSVLLLKKVWIMGSLSHPTHPSYFSAGAPQPPWEPLVFRNQHFCGCFCFNLLHPQISSLSIWEFCGNGISSIHGLVRLCTIGAKTWGNSVCVWSSKFWVRST